ncbi:hypothetical protein [Nocardia pseudovaccinii]|uniref:hypothetical protein n=1 Tax=Nocardia pseudovaccinii TaxID=189540 RepID=UPI000B0DEDEF|nr:hypothetical protein [Nocardia pseudovaccinii]
MGKHRPTHPVRLIRRRTATLVLASALPLSAALTSTTPANAESQPLGTATLSRTPYGLAHIADPSAPVDDPAVFTTLPLRDATAPVAEPDATVPDMPNAAQPDQVPQAPLATNRIRIGNIQVDRPDFLPPDVADQINGASMATEGALSQGLQSMGVERARSDQIASTVVGDAVVGASVGSTLASPLAATSAVVGAAAGLIAGIPFLPAGLVVVPIIGAGIGYAVIAIPAAAVGAAAGAAVGVVHGAVTPIPTQEQPAIS